MLMINSDIKGPATNKIKAGQCADGQLGDRPSTSSAV